MKRPCLYFTESMVTIYKWRRVKNCEWQCHRDASWEFIEACTPEHLLQRNPMVTVWYCFESKLNQDVIFCILISTEIITACGRIWTSHLLISMKLDNSCPWRITTCQTNTKYSRLQQLFTTFKNCPTQLHRCYVHRKIITIKPSENHP